MDTRTKRKKKRLKQIKINWKFPTFINCSSKLSLKECCDCNFLIYLRRYKSVTDKLEPLIYICQKYQRYRKSEFNSILKDKYTNMFKFRQGDLNKFALLIRKRVYLYKYKDKKEKHNVIYLLSGESFYSILIIEIYQEYWRRWTCKTYLECFLNETFRCLPWCLCQKQC